jgi:hypothetical protein
VEAACFGDVGEYATLDDDTSFHALTQDPGQIDGGVYAY